MRIIYWFEFRRWRWTPVKTAIWKRSVDACSRNLLSLLNFNLLIYNLNLNSNSFSAEKMAGKGTRKSGKAKKQQTAHSRADLIFPVGRLTRYLREGKYSDRSSVGAGVFMAAVLEYLCSEILELAGEHTKKDKRIQMMPRHIQLAVRNDEELNKVMCEAMIANGGVVPMVHSALFPKKKGSKEEMAAGTQEM